MSCLMSFGDLNIPSSRAFWDDCDEDELLQEETTKLELKYVSADDEKQLKNIEHLLVVEGLEVTAFIKDVLLENAQPICCIPNTKTTIYNLEDQKLHVLVVDEDLPNSGQVTNLLLPFLSISKHVTTITLKSKIDYKTTDMSNIRDKVTFLCSLSGNIDKIEKLQPPNFITGVTAGVASWRSNEQLQISSYVAYTDKLPLDGLAAQPILKLMNSLGIKCRSSYRAKSRDESYLYL